MTTKQPDGPILSPDFGERVGLDRYSLLLRSNQFTIDSHSRMWSP